MDKGLIGTAKTVFVFRVGDSAKAVVSSISARVLPGCGRKRLRFTGPVWIDPLLRSHISRVVLPLVDRVLEALGQPRHSFEISVANPAFSSVAEVPLSIQGFSADSPIYLALWSAALEIPISQRIVSTGHIASAVETIRLVAGLPEKIEASIRDPEVTTFICPSLADASLETMCPKEKQHAEDAVTQGRMQIQVLTVSNIGELLEAVSTPRDIVLASLRKGFFEIPPQGPATGPVAGSVRLHTAENDRHFWNFLQADFFSGQVKEGKELLLARFRYHIRKRSYPKDLGARLWQILASLPPYIRRRKDLFPPISTKECIDITQFASESDLEDVKKLYDSTCEKGISRRKARTPLQDNPSANAAEDALNDIISRIDARALSESIGSQVDAARLCFTLDRVTADSADDLFEIIESFYIHLGRYCGLLAGNVDPEAVSDQAYALFSRAFSRNGGLQAALSEARDGVRGGLRFVLDSMTEQTKREEVEKRLERVIRETLQTWEEKTAFAEALLRRLGPDLPEDLRGKTPAQCAHHCETLLRAYVNSMEQVHSLLRTL